MAFVRCNIFEMPPSSAIDLPKTATISALSACAQMLRVAIAVASQGGEVAKGQVCADGTTAVDEKQPQHCCHSKAARHTPLFASLAILFGLRLQRFFDRREGDSNGHRDSTCLSHWWCIYELHDC